MTLLCQLPSVIHLALAGLVLVGLMLWIAYRTLKKNRPAACAKRGFDALKQLYSGPAEFVEVEPRDYNWLDHSFYQEASAQFQRFGYRHLGDLESLRAARCMPNFRTLVRCFVSQDGEVAAAVYQILQRRAPLVLRLLGLKRADVRIVEFSSDFTDGSSLNTGNTQGRSAALDVRPEVTKQAYPSDTAVDVLLALHLAKLQQFLEDGRQAVRVRTVADLIALLEREHARQCIFRQSRGYITREELEGIADHSSSPAISEFIEATLRAAATCGHCGHDVAGNTSGVCPECGTPRAGRENANRTAECEQEQD